MKDGKNKELDKSIKSYSYPELVDNILYIDVKFNNTEDITSDILYPDFLVVELFEHQMIVDAETFAMLDQSEARHETTAIPPQYTEW